MSSSLSRAESVELDVVCGGLIQVAREFLSLRSNIFRNGALDREPAKKEFACSALILNVTLRATVICYL